MGDFIQGPLKHHPKREILIEIVLDIGRRPEARFADSTEYLSYRTVVWQDLDYIIKRLGKFSDDNRAGIEKTLHRISSLRNRQGNVIGLTCRIGRAVFGTELEATAARTIAERGVQLIGTAHGSALENLIKNPTITDLIGGIQYVTLGDEEAKRRGSAKSILERKASPTFEIAIEIHNSKTWIIHDNIANSVDLFLRGQTPPLQKRQLTSKQAIQIRCQINYNMFDTDSHYQTNSVERSSVDKKQKKSVLLNKISLNEDWKSQKNRKIENRARKKVNSIFL